MGGMGGSGAAGQEMTGIVDWSSQSWETLQGHFQWTIAPESIRIRLAQEEIWVYMALLRIIDKTNGNVQYHYKAAVKQILELQIGQDAARAATGSMGGGPMGMGGMGGPMGMGSMGMMSGGSSMPGGAMGAAAGASSGGSGGAGDTGGASSASDMLKRQYLDNRYVDQKGQPLAYGTDPPFKEFKMMPVRMVLLVNQKKIPNLLAECGNDYMPVIVRRLILELGNGQQVDLQAVAGGSGGGMMGGGVSMARARWVQRRGQQHAGGNGHEDGDAADGNGWTWHGWTRDGWTRDGRTTWWSSVLPNPQ